MKGNNHCGLTVALETRVRTYSHVIAEAGNSFGLGVSYLGSRKIDECPGV